MKAQFRCFRTLLLGCLLTASVFAQNGATGLSFLKIGVGGRTIGMGDAGVATASLGSAAHYNPALLTSQEHPSITMMHNQYIQDLTAQYLGAVVPLDGITLGFHLGLTSVADAEIRQVPGDPIGTFTSRSFTSGISAAFSFSDEIDVGVTMKFLFEKLHVDEASGYAFDAGMRIRPFEEGDLKPLTAGVSIANLGQMSELRSAASNLPSLLRYGVSYTVPFASMNGSLLFEADGLTIFDAKTTHVNLGVEVAYDNALFARFGYQTNYDNKGFSAGIGANYAIMRFDYAVTPWSEGFGLAHAVSLSVIF